MRRNIYTFIFLCCFCIPISGSGQQNYEGIITYRLLIEAINPTLSTYELQSMFGDTMRLYLKDNNYKMVFNGNYAQEILYTGDENKHYISLGPIDSMIWRYCNEHASSVIYTRAVENADYVLDYACNAYSLQTDWGLTTYYYSPELYLNPKSFKNHVFNYFNVYVQHARAPYLKYVYTGPSFKMTLVAVDIKQEVISASVFDAQWKQMATAETSAPKSE